MEALAVFAVTAIIIYGSLFTGIIIVVSALRVLDKVSDRLKRKLKSLQEKQEK